MELNMYLFKTDASKVTVSQIKTHLDNNQDPNIKAPTFSMGDNVMGGFSACHIAIAKCNNGSKGDCSKGLEIVKLLHRHSADLDMVDIKGATPLMYCAMYDRLEIAKYLIEQNVDKTKKLTDGPDKGWTAYDIAIDTTNGTMGSPRISAILN
jgi:ankyrin repeat protein